MFRKNNEHQQETLLSPVKALPTSLKKKLENHWSTHFYEHVFIQIDEEKFAPLYHDGYSRPNKPVNELVALEIVKQLRGLSDEELEHAYIFDFTVRNALGKEMMDDNISPKTFTNFRRRLLEYEEETGRDLLHEVFEENRSHLMDEFDIDGSTQRMDSTFIDANIKKLSRIDLIAKVIHNFLRELPDNRTEELPAGLDEFAARENLQLSYQLAPGEVQPTLDTLVEHAAWLVDRFEGEDADNDLERFGHLQQVLDEQCVRIPELEEDEELLGEDACHADDEDDDERPGWEPVRKFESQQEEPSDDAAGESLVDTDQAGEQADHVALKDPDEIDSGSLQNPHDDEATYRRKRDEEHFGYKANLAETCGSEDNPFRLITAVRVDPNNTDDAEMLAEDVPALAQETGLEDLLNDGGYTSERIEGHCHDAGITQHFSGIKGLQPAPEKISVADAEWDGRELVACPQGFKPYEQAYNPDNRRYTGRMEREICENCPDKEDCFVIERQGFFSYGITERHMVIAHRRARMNDPEMHEFLDLRAGAESMINEVFQPSGKRTKFTGTRKVKNATIAKAIGTNLKRTSRYLTEVAEGEELPA